jgi:glycosyltransferase involved in cell wall biosynthesis
MNEEKKCSQVPQARLILFKGVYDTLDLFIDEFAQEYKIMGYEVMIFQSRDMTESLGELLEFTKQPINAVITFNNLGFNMELVAGKNIWDELGVFCINILVDHPFLYKNALISAPKQAAVLCIDRNHMKYIQRFHTNIPISGFLPHGGTSMLEGVKPLCERKIDVLYAGRLSKNCMEAVLPDLNSILEFDAKKVCDRAYQQLITHPEQTTEQALEESIRKEKVSFTEAQLSDWVTQLRFVDLLAASYFREQVVKSLVEAGISVHVYGNGWEECPWSDNPNFIYGGKVKPQKILEFMQDSKIVLSTMTWFKDGTHVRVFDGMLAGAVTVSDTSLFMKEEFCYKVAADETDQRELLMFELNQIDQLPDMVHDLLDDLDTAQSIALRGNKRAKKEYTWRCRAHELADELILQEEP